MAWEDAVINLAEEEVIRSVYPDWYLEDNEPPPQPDWYVAMEIAQDLGMSLPEFTELPCSEPFISIMATWALIRREALYVSSTIQAAARARASALQK